MHIGEQPRGQEGELRPASSCGCAQASRSMALRNLRCLCSSSAGPLAGSRPRSSASVEQHPLFEREVRLHGRMRSAMMPATAARDSASRVQRRIRDRLAFASSSRMRCVARSRAARHPHRRQELTTRVRPSWFSLSVIRISRSNRLDGGFGGASATLVDHRQRRKACAELRASPLTRVPVRYRSWQRCRSRSVARKTSSEPSPRRCVDHPRGRSQRTAARRTALVATVQLVAAHGTRQRRLVEDLARGLATPS